MILHAAEFFVIPPCGGGVGGEAVALLPIKLLRLFHAAARRKHGKREITEE